MPLSLGIVNLFEERGLVIFGPTREAAQSETSKSFTKLLCQTRGIPTAQCVVSDSFESAQELLAKFSPPWVVKADGLAGGKGVTVTGNKSEALEAIKWCLARAPGLVLVEEYIDGWEFTVIATIAGEEVCWVAPIFQDAKRSLDGDRGPHTGGMGPFTPVPQATPGFVINVMETILRPLAKALVQNGTPYYGVMSPNLIARTSTEAPYLLECNARFGDPEMQCLAPFIEKGLARHFWSIARKARPQEPVGLKICEGFAAGVAVVVAAQGYPDDPQYGTPINLREPRSENAFIFHAGTSLDAYGALVTSGGRVLNVVGIGSDLESARTIAYSTIKNDVHFDGMHYRTDIGLLGASVRRPPRTL